MRCCSLLLLYAMSIAAFAEAPPTNARDLIAGVIDVPAIDISATEIRRRVRDGLPIRYWVPDPVAGYISRHRLYLDPA